CASGERVTVLSRDRDDHGAYVETLFSDGRVERLHPSHVRPLTFLELLEYRRECSSVRKRSRTASRWTRVYERRYHASWTALHGLSPLNRLGRWLYEQNTHLPRGAKVSERLGAAPPDLLTAALEDVTARLPGIAAREPTRRHRKHFTWLLGWQLRLLEALAR